MGTRPIVRAVAVAAAVAAAGAVLVQPSSAQRATYRPDRVVLTPTAQPATSQTFTWRTRAAAGRVVVSGSGRQRSMRATKVRRIGTSRHLTATVGGLRPGTTYRYRVGSRRGWSGWASFRTPRATAAPTSIVVLGDAQKGLRSSLPAVTRRAMSAAPDADLLLQLGDLVNSPRKDAQWDAAFDALGPYVRHVPFAGVAGNHEYCCGDPRASRHRAHLEGARNGVHGQASTWWWTDVQGVRVVVLDGNRKIRQQAAFMDRAARTNPSRWTIVAFHQPVFAGRADRTEPAIRKYWLPVLERRDVDLVLTGHDHVYTRGYRRADGPQYVTMNSGPKYYDLAPAGSNDFTRHGATRAVGIAGTSVYATVRVDGDTLVMEAVVSGKGRGATTSRGVGQVLDRVTITDDGHAKHVR